MPLRWIAMLAIYHHLVPPFAYFRIFMSLNIYANPIDVAPHASLFRKTGNLQPYGSCACMKLIYFGIIVNDVET